MKLFATTALLAASTLVGTAHAAEIYIDLGKKTKTGVAGGVTYNDVATNGFVFAAGDVSLILGTDAATTSPIALLDTTGAVSGITLEIDKTTAGGYVGDNGSDFAGPYPASLSGIETSAKQSLWTLGRGADILVKFAGLDDGKTYNIVIYGGHNQAGSASNSTIDFVPQVGSGADFTSKSLQTFNNTTDVVTYTNIASVGGSIDILFDDNDVAGAEGWLNFISVTEVVPEPSSLALIGLGGLCMLRRRRD